MPSSPSRITWCFCAITHRNKALPDLKNNADKNVGAGVHAKAVDQSPDRLTEAPLSRASPLPHLSYIPSAESSLFWRQKYFFRFSNVSFTRHSSVFFVVAPLFSNSSGIKLYPRANSLYPLAQSASAINIVLVPSLLIFQEISRNRMSGQELCLRVPLIPPVTIISVLVRYDLHSDQRK